MEKEGSQNNIVQTKELQILCNTFIYDDNIIQLDNVSEISVAPIDKLPNPVWAILLAVIGVILLIVGKEMVAIGLAAIIVGGGTWVYVIYKNSQLGHYLRIELNSGRKIYFSGKDDVFLKKIMRTMGDCMNNKKDSYIIHMEQASIDKIQIGDSNQIL